MRLPLWRLIRAQSACYQTTSGDCEDWTLETNFNYNSPQRAHLFRPFSEGSDLSLTQLLHHLVKQAVFILQQITWLSSFSIYPWIQNLLTSERNPLAHNISQYHIIAQTIFQKGARQGEQTDSVWVVGLPGVKKVWLLFYWADKGLAWPFNITMLSERKKMSFTLGLLALCSILYSAQGIWGCFH